MVWFAKYFVELRVFTGRKNMVLKYTKEEALQFPEGIN
jgi:hypothetical protein